MIILLLACLSASDDSASTQGLPCDSDIPMPSGMGVFEAVMIIPAQYAEWTIPEGPAELEYYYHEYVPMFSGDCKAFLVAETDSYSMDSSITPNEEGAECGAACSADVVAGQYSACVFNIICDSGSIP